MVGNGSGFARDYYRNSTIQDLGLGNNLGSERGIMIVYFHRIVPLEMAWKNQTIVKGKQVTSIIMNVSGYQKAVVKLGSANDNAS